MTTNSHQLEKLQIDRIIPQSVIAKVAGCDVETVRKVRAGARGKSGTAKKASAVKFVDKYLHDQIGIAIRRCQEIIGDSENEAA